jgi:thymidine phosphorylase
MQAIVEAQGGDVRVVDEPDRLRVARHRLTVVAPKRGYIREIDALELGYASMGLGAGRTRTEDPVDPGAGIRLHVRRGDQVRTGQELATLYSSKRSRLEGGAKRVRACFEIGKTRPEPRHRIIETIRR